MKSDTDSINIQRVDNGWVVASWMLSRRIDGGYMPEGTHVASTPAELAKLILEWASAQESK